MPQKWFWPWSTFTQKASFTGETQTYMGTVGDISTDRRVDYVCVNRPSARERYPTRSEHCVDKSGNGHVLDYEASFDVKYSCGYVVMPPCGCRNGARFDNFVRIRAGA